MVWKFNTVEAQEKHAERAIPQEPSFTPTDDTRTDSRVEPSFYVSDQPVAPQLAEPSFDVEHPQLLSVVEPQLQDSEVESQDQELKSRGIAVMSVELEEIPSGDLNWDVPAFAGTVDELPDLRPIPPAPEEHPGLQHRTANNFGHALRFPHDDARQTLWAEQRRDRGFDDTELWGLDDAFARFILPRLKALRQQKLAPPTRMELVVWYSMLDKMIRAFELLLPEGGGAWDRGSLNDKERAQVQEGLDHFRQYYFSLCW